MSSRVRAFIALPVAPRPELESAVEELRRLGPALRVTPPEQRHITLKFLGDLSAGEIAPLADAVSRALAGEAVRSGALRGLGAFPSRQRPAVVWAGLDDAATVQPLFERVEEVCTRIGHPAESRRFHPHATVARVKGRAPAGLSPLLAEHRETLWGSVRLTSVVLYESVLSRSGSQYHALAKFPLVPKGDGQ